METAVLASVGRSTCLEEGRMGGMVDMEGGLWLLLMLRYGL